MMTLTRLIMRAMEEDRVSDLVQIQEDVFDEYVRLDLYSNVERYEAYVKEIYRRYEGDTE